VVLLFAYSMHETTDVVTFEKSSWLGNNVFVEILVSVDAVCHHCHDVYSAKIYVTSLNIRFCVKFDQVH